MRERILQKFVEKYAFFGFSFAGSLVPNLAVASFEENEKTGPSVPSNEYTASRNVKATPFFKIFPEPIKLHS